MEKNASGTVVPVDLLPYIPDLPGCLPFPAPCSLNRVAVNGAFKTPSLRNVELTGPYFHNGGASTLMQVVEFYARGGNFPGANVDNLNPFIAEIGSLREILAASRTWWLSY